MSKHSLETKKHVVDYVQNENHSINDAAIKFGVANELIRRWVKRFEQFGHDGLIMKNGTYSGDFKLNVLKYMHTNHLSLFETAVHFGIPNSSTLGKWERIYYEEGSDALFRDKRGRRCKDMSQKGIKKPLPKKIEEDLISEVQRLRMENDYLKKLIALAQKREEKKTKIK